ncbi:MAG: RNB domain-containing ribonuclease, partial [Candidatus Binatia bacterium]
MQNGTIVIYRERGRLALGVIQKVVTTSGKTHVELIDQDGRKQMLAPDRVALDCRRTLALSLPLVDLKRHLQDVYDQIRTRAQTVPLKDLWDLLQEEAGKEFASEELAEFLLISIDDPLATAGVLDALWNQNIYFKEKRAGFFTPRDAKSVEDSLHQQQVEEQHARAQGEFLAWIRARLADPAHAPSPSPGFDRYLDLLKGLALYGDAYERKAQALRLFEEIGFRGKGHPWDVAFQVLVALDVWKEDEELCVLRYQIPTRFPAEVLQAAADTPEFIADSQDYTDLTSLFTFTIDDAETTEVDDALSFSEEAGSVQVGIHITDAGFFVPPGGVIDKSALHRGTTVYLPRGKLPMLPPVLSEDRASLVADTLRPTLSFFATVDATGCLQTEKICRGLMRVGRRLSYTEADALLQSEAQDPCTLA